MMILGVTTFLLAVPPQALDPRLEKHGAFGGSAHVKEHAAFKPSAPLGGSKFVSKTHVTAQGKKKGQSALGGTGAHVQAKSVKKATTVLALDGTSVSTDYIASSCSLVAGTGGPETTSVIGGIEIPSTKYDAVPFGPTKPYDFQCPTATIPSCCDLTDDTGCDATAITAAGALSVITSGGLDDFVRCYQCACPTTCNKYPAPTCAQCYNCLASCPAASAAIYSTFPGTSTITEAPLLGAGPPEIATAGPPITNPASTLDFRCPSASIDSCCDLTDDTGCDPDALRASPGAVSVLSDVDAFVDCYRCACPKTCEKFTVPVGSPSEKCFEPGSV